MNMDMWLYGNALQCTRLEPYVSRSYQQRHIRHSSTRLIKKSKAY